VQDFLIVFNR